MRCVRNHREIMSSISNCANAISPSQVGVEIHCVLMSVLTDLAALTSSVNQLIADYNANETIAADTLSAPVTLVTRL